MKIFLIALFLTLKATSYPQVKQTEVIDQNIEAAEKYLKEGNKAEAARLYNQTAYLYRVAEDFTEAIKYYEKVLQLNTELNNQVGKMLTHSNLSMLYIETEQYSQALTNLKAELEYREKAKKVLEIIPVQLSIAGVYNELSQYKEALEYAGRATELSLEISDLPMLKRSYGISYDIYSKWGKQQDAQKYFDLYSAIDKKIKEERMAAVETEANQKVSEAYTEKAKTEQELTITSKELKQTAQSLEEAERIAQQQKLELDLQQAQINEATALLKLETLKKTLFKVGFSVLLFFVLILVFLIIRLRKANIEITHQREKLDKQNQEIKASIRYAKTIQTAMLPDMVLLNKFVEHFVIYRPKDIVSGDFYWSSITSENRMYFSVVDCTGHGVPGAFMSMIGMRMLDEIVNDKQIESPGLILEMLNSLLRSALRQEQTDNNDGMDMLVCRFDKLADGTLEMTYSGAKRPIYIGRKSKPELEFLNPARKSIGGNQPAKREIDFEDIKVSLSPGDNVYMFSDGIVDQNDPYRKKFGRARLENILVTVLNDDSERQRLVVESKLDDFIKDEQQRDDITFVGFKIK